MRSDRLDVPTDTGRSRRPRRIQEHRDAFHRRNSELSVGRLWSSTSSRMFSIILLPSLVWLDFAIPSHSLRRFRFTLVSCKTTDDRRVPCSRGHKRQSDGRTRLKRRSLCEDVQTSIRDRYKNKRFCPLERMGKTPYCVEASEDHM